MNFLLDQHEHRQPDLWKVFIFFGSIEEDTADTWPCRKFVRSLQTRYTHALIVGGVSDSVALVASGSSSGGDEFIVGVALGGDNVPIQVRALGGMRH
jgi:hypothetical protein